MHKVKKNQNVNAIPGGIHYTQNPSRHRSDVKRYTICALILALSALAAYTLGLRLISQIHYLRARNFMQQGYYGLASQALQKASIYQPKDYKIHRQWANAVYKLGEFSPTARGAYELAGKAKDRYKTALMLNPLDAQSAYGLAWQEERLGLLYTKLNPGEKTNRHNALPFYELAISLRPNGIQYHYALARYLHRRGKQDKMHRVMRKLARIYPPAYTHLKKEDFWSDNVKAACRQGLQDAIKDSILPAAAHLALVDMAAEDKNWAGAIAHYQQALQLVPLKETDQAHFKLGRLFLKNGDLQAARGSFIKSLSLSRTREKSLERLYRVFKEEGMLNEFNNFYPEVRQQFPLSIQTDILLARSLIDLKQYDQARRVIEKLIADEPTAEAYYWLAQAARKEEDWDQMERAIQKATVVEPENNHYRQIFFRLLKRTKKFESAEIQLDLIINHSNRPSANLYNEKAWLRWIQKDYVAAVEAWQSAIRLKPDSAAYYAQTAEAYVMLGNWSGAVAYYENAIKFNPQNKRYTERYRELMGNDTEG